MVQEISGKARSGFGPLFLFLLVLLSSPWLLMLLDTTNEAGNILRAVLGKGAGIAVVISVAVIGFISGIIGLVGLVSINPNESRVLTLFGEYKGTLKQSGFFWVNPFYLKRLVSLRIRSFETGTQSETTTSKDAAGNLVTTDTGRKARHAAKVNDLDGNPIEIAAVVVWRVIDASKALFDVDDYQDYVHIQSESALRSLASRHPYDSHDDGRISLRGSPEIVGEELKSELKHQLLTAGVEVVEARISMLAYAPEIAAVMLRRQQASAILAARRIIVDGAVGMVEMALERLDKDKRIVLDDERRAAMVSNLLVVLCGEKEAVPVINAGTLHS